MGVVFVAAPTSLRGYVSDNAYGDILDELTADLPADLIWPNSVVTYGSMRREAHISAALGGYTLQLRRAQWQLDPSGCRPEVVQMLADDMGLPVKGQDVVGAARVRGVSWHDHLRAALLSLSFGHNGFELGADTSSGHARLVTLAERLPNTLTRIHSDPKTGDFLGVTQNAGRTLSSPQIKADRMAFYCHEREGASWAGVSMLRSSWPAYLIKREMLRVHATANRRWAAGVPVMEALAGTNPTPAQMAEAQTLASAARAGDQAGASTPPGFTMKILGMSGAVPDTVGFLRYLNQEMSRAVLMPFLDLGTSETGSRALGESFTETWLLALGAIGDEIRDVATRHIAARLVEWNFGESEPVPSVVVSGIGSRRDVTAESLDLLMRSGALSADPGLESWIRREYRLPERETPTVTPPPAKAEPAVAPPPPAPVAAATLPATPRKRAARRPRKESAPGQLAFPILAAARQPTTEELAAGVDPAAIQAAWQQQVDELASDWQQVADPMTEEIVAVIVAAVAAGTFADLVASGGLVVPAAVVAAMATPIAAGMLALGNASAAQVAGEVASQGVTIDAPTLDEATVNAHAQAAAQVIASGYSNGAAQVALANAGPEADAETVGGRVREHLDGVTSTAVANDPNGRGWVVGNLSSVMSQAQGMGRMAAFQALEAAGHAPAYVASEVNDASRCDPCSEIDGTRFDTLADAVAAYPIGQFHACLGATRCRGFLFAAVRH